MNEQDKIPIEKKIDKLTSSYNAPFKKSKNEVWDDLISKIEDKSEQKYSKTFRLNKPWFYAAASFLILVLASWFFINLGKITIITKKGEHQIYYLPDNSKVILNSDSKLEYSKFKWFLLRKVDLSGEAFFQVTTDEKFIVKTEQAKVNVLGTEFNVYSRDDYFEAKCFSGKVEVSSKKDKVILTRGEGSSIDKKSEKSNQFDFNIVSYKDWQDGVFSFNQKPLEFVFNELGRVFNVQVVLPDIVKDRLYTGIFENENLENALEMICLPMQLEYTFTNDQTIVIKE